MTTDFFRNIKMVPFPVTQYIREESPKTQIVLHHTASGRGVDGDFHHWLSTPGRIATCVIVAHDGTIHQAFSSKFWAYHLGMRHAANRERNQQSIAIEIDSWGALSKVGSKFFSYTGKEIPRHRVQSYPVPYRGSRFFEKYTEQQISSVRDLLLYWKERYNIPLAYRPTMWDVSAQAINGTPGIWSHTSFRKDKSDCHPQPELIEMLKSLDS